MANGRGNDNTPPSFVTVDFPKFHTPINGRSDEISALLANIKQLAETPERGFLLVSGADGIGKTSLVAHVFNDESNRDFFLRDCNLHVAIWFNCSEFRGKTRFDADSQRTFTQRMMALARRALSDQSAPFPNFASIVGHFERQKKRRVIFLLDNVPNCGLLEFIHETCPRSIENLICCVIGGDPGLPKNLFREQSLEVSQVSNTQIQAFFSPLRNGGKVSEGKIGELVHLCRGLPLLASVIAARFRIDTPNNYRTICDNLLAYQAELTLETVLSSILEKMTEDQLVRFCSFLYFEPEEPISIIDLVNLWSATQLDIAKSQCGELETMSLIRRVGPVFQEKVDRFVVHHQIHEAALDFKANPRLKDLLYNVKALRGGALLLALKMGVAPFIDMTLDSDRSLMKILQRAAIQERIYLWEKLLENWNVAKFVYEKCPEAARLQDPQRRTALIIASKIGKFDLVKCIFEKNPTSIAVADKKLGQSPLAWAVSHNAPIDVIKFLLEKNPDAIKVRDIFFGQTPLSLAVEYTDLDTVSYLLEHFPGAIETEDVIGRMPLCIAAEMGRYDLVQFLYEKFPEAISKTDDCYGRTPLFWAAENGNFEIVRFLYAKFPRAVKMPDEEGKLPVERALLNGHRKVVDYLQSLR